MSFSSSVWRRLHLFRRLQFNCYLSHILVLLKNEYPSSLCTIVYYIFTRTTETWAFSDISLQSLVNVVVQIPFSSIDAVDVCFHTKAFKMDLQLPLLQRSYPFRTRSEEARSTRRLCEYLPHMRFVVDCIACDPSPSLVLRPESRNVCVCARGPVCL